MRFSRLNLGYFSLPGASSIWHLQRKARQKDTANFLRSIASLSSNAGCFLNWHCHERTGGGYHHVITIITSCTPPFSLRNGVLPIKKPLPCDQARYRSFSKKKRIPFPDSAPVANEPSRRPLSAGGKAARRREGACRFRAKRVAWRQTRGESRVLFPSPGAAIGPVVAAENPAVRRSRPPARVVSFRGQAYAVLVGRWLSSPRCCCGSRQSSRRVRRPLCSVVQTPESPP